jgi:hypothetical protein
MGEYFFEFETKTFDKKSKSKSIEWKKLGLYLEKSLPILGIH